MEQSLVLKLSRTFSRLFLYAALLIFPLGNILRIPIGNGVSLLGLDIAVGGAFLTALPYLFSHKRALKQDRRFLVVSVFFLWTVITLLLNSYWLGPLQSFISALYGLRFLAYVSLIWSIEMFDQPEKRLFLRVLILSGITMMLGGLAQYLLYPDLRNLFYLGWDEHLYRLFGTLFDPNFMGAILLIVLGVLVYSVQHRVFKRKYVIVSSIVTITALFLTYSRSAFLAFATSLGLWAALKRSQKTLLIGVTLFVGALFLLPQGLNSEGVKLLRTASIDARVSEYQQALHISQKSPIWGIGFNAYRYAQLKEGYIDLDTWESDHAAAGVPNSYIFVLATTGVIGLGLYLMWLALIAKSLYKRNQIIVFVMLVGLGVHALFENSLFYPFEMFLLFSFISLAD